MRSATTAGMTEDHRLGDLPAEDGEELESVGVEHRAADAAAARVGGGGGGSGAICCWKKSVMETSSFVSVAPFTADCDLTVSEMTRYTAASFAFHELTGSAAC